MARRSARTEVGETLGGCPSASLSALRTRAANPGRGRDPGEPGLPASIASRTSLRLAVARAGSLRHPALDPPVEVREADGLLAVVYETSAAGR